MKIDGNLPTYVCEFKSEENNQAKSDNELFDIDLRTIVSSTDFSVKNNRTATCFNVCHTGYCTNFNC